MYAIALIKNQQTMTYKRKYPHLLLEFKLNEKPHPETQKEDPP